MRCDEPAANCNPCEPICRYTDYFWPVLDNQVIGWVGSLLHKLDQSAKMHNSRLEGLWSQELRCIWTFRQIIECISLKKDFLNIYYKVSNSRHSIPAFAFFAYYLFPFQWFTHRVGFDSLLRAVVSACLNRNINQCYLTQLVTDGQNEWRWWWRWFLG